MRRLEIILARHGPASGGVEGRPAGRDLDAWSRAYASAGLEPGAKPPPSLAGVAQRAGCIVASDLRRAVESAKALVSNAEFRIEPLVREVPLPTSFRTRTALPVGAWLFLARVGWWVGLNPGAEPLEVTRQRAGLAADALVRLAQRHGVVLVVGHGIFNLFLARELRRRGWRGPVMPTPRHWTTAAYRLARPGG